MDDYATYLWRINLQYMQLSAYAVEDAIGAKVPVNAQYSCNMILAGYAFTTISCISINSTTGSGSPRYKLILKSGRYAKRCLCMVIKQCQRIPQRTEKIQALVDSGQLGISLTVTSVIGSLKLPPEVNSLPSRTICKPLNVSA